MWCRSVAHCVPAWSTTSNLALFSPNARLDAACPMRETPDLAAGAEVVARAERPRHGAPSGGARRRTLTARRDEDQAGEQRRRGDCAARKRASRHFPFPSVVSLLAQQARGEVAAVAVVAD